MRDDARELERETKRLGCIGPVIGAAGIWIAVSAVMVAAGNSRGGAVLWMLIAALAVTVAVGVLLAARSGGNIVVAAILSFLFFPLGWLVALSPSRRPVTVSRQALRIIFAAVVVLSLAILALFAYLSGGG